MVRKFGKNLNKYKVTKHSLVIFKMNEVSEHKEKKNKENLKGYPVVPDNSILKNSLKIKKGYLHLKDLKKKKKASLVAQEIKKLPAMQETWVQSLGWEDTLKKGMAFHSSIFVWEIPWTKETGGLQFMGLQSQT